MVSEGCDIRYHALAFCTAGIESTTIPQAWFEVVPECATYIPPNRLPTPCSTAHNKHHLHLDTVAKAPPLCYHIHTSGASGTDAGTSWVDGRGGRGGRGSRRHSVMQQCARRARGGVGAHHLQPVKWYQSRYHFCSCVSTWYDRRYRLLRSWIRGTNLGTTCSTRGYVVRT